MINRLAIRFSWCFLALICAAVPLSAATFSSTTSGNWSSAATWGGAGVPGAGDTATVNGGHVVTLDIPVTVATLTLGGGQINGTQSLAVTTVFNWNGGTLSGGGTTTVAAATLGGGGILDTRSLSNSGAFNVTAGNYFYMQNNAAFSNSGTVDFQGDGGGIFQSGSLGTMAITNSGTIKKSGNTGSTTLQIPISAQSGSQLLAQSGTLNVGAVTSNGGTFSASTGATLAFNTSDTRTFDAASTISGAGTIYWAAGTNSVNGNYNVTGTTQNSGATTIGSITSVGTITVIGGTLTLNGASTLSVATLSMQGGTLAGTAPISLTGTTQTWTGGTIAGSGLLTIPNTTTVTFNGYVYFDTRSISNAGTLNYTSSYYSYFYNSATLANSGTVDFQGDGGFYVGSGNPSVTNSGTIKKSAGTSASGLQVALTAQSGSQILAQSGTFYLGQVAATGATFSVSSGATLSAVYGNTRTFDSASTISGAGSVSWGSGTNTVNAGYNVTGGTSNSGATTSIGTNVTALGDVTVSGGTLTITNSAAPAIGNITSIGGTLTLNIAATLSIPILAMQGGTVNGTAPISITGATQTWTGGTIGGSGLLTIPNTTTVTFNGYVYFDTRPVSNAGTLNYTGNFYSYFYNSAAFTNSGTVDFQGDGGFYIGSGSPSVTNSGTIKKSAGTGQGGIQVSLIAQSGSQLLVQSGTLLLGNVTSTGATLSVSNGATAQFYYTTAASFDAASFINGAGTVNFGAGTDTVSAAYNITGATKNSGATTTISNITSVGALTISGGTLTLNGAGAISVPTLTTQGGILNGTAPITITGTAMSWAGGTIGGSGQLTIPNVATITNSGIVIDARPVSNAGTINLVSGGTMYLQNNAVLTNSGTIDLQSDGSVLLNGGASTAIVNSGTIKKSAGASGSSFSVPLTLQSGSQFLVQNTIVYLGNVTSNGGTLDVSNGATAYFYYTTAASFDAASFISGAGTVNFGAGTDSVSGAYNVTGATKNSGATTTLSNITSVGALTVSGGTLTLNSAGAISVPTLTMQGGTLNGTAPITITGTAMSWSGGIIGGSGQLTIPNIATITSSGIFIDARPVSNAGTINLVSGGTTYLQNNAVLTNSGTIDLQSDGSVLLNGGASTAIVNGGTIKKSAGTNGSSFSVPLTLQSGSQFLVQNTIVYLGNVTSNGGTLDVSNGATAYFYYTTTASFDAASFISGAGTVNFGAGTDSVSGAYNITGNTRNSGATTTLSNITSVGALTVSGGTLTLNSAGAISVPTLTMQGGTLNGTAPINITGTAMSWSGGIVGGSGTLSIPVGTTITVNGGPYLDARPVTNAGTINFTGGNYLYMQNNAVLTNSGTIDIQGDGAIYQSGPTGTTAVVNGGTIKKSAGASGSTFNVPLTLQSGSQFLVQSSIVYFGNITSSGGTLNISSGTIAYLYYTTTATFDAASIISGAGTLQCAAGTNTVSGSISSSITMSSGTLTLNSASTLTVPTLTMQGGTLNGTANINLTSTAMTWSGGIVGGGGTLSIPAPTTITIAGVPYLDARSVTNAGTIVFNSTNYMYMQNNAVLTNNGTINFAGDSSLYLSGPAGTTAVVNNGTIRKSAGASGSTFSVPLTMASGSQFQVQSSIVYFGNIASTGATLSISPGTTAYLYYTTAATFDAASVISGGTLQCAAGTNTVSGTISSSITMSSGTLTINSAAAQSIPTLTMQGGTLNGTATINLTSAAMTWTGGTIGGGGTLSIPVGTVVTINGVPFLDSRNVSNAGTIAFNSTNYMYLQNNAVLANSGTIDFQGDSSLYLNTGTATVNNGGVIKKSAGSGASYLTVPLSMLSGSQLLVQSGTLYLGGTLTSTGGTFNVSSGATLGFAYNDTRTFDAASSIGGAGALLVQSGTNTFAGTLSANVTVSGGTLTINSGGTQSIPTLAMNGGVLNGTANVNVTGASMTWTGGTVGGSGALTISAASTVNINGIPFFDGRPVTNNGSIAINSTNYTYLQNGAVLTNNGNLGFTGDGAIYFYTGAACSIVNNGTFGKSGGTGTSTVSVPVTNAAAGTIKAQAGTLSFTNGLAQSGTLLFPISGATSFGRVNVSGAFALGGTLTATTVSYTPANNTPFVILGYGSFSGAFANKNLDYSAGTFTEQYSPTSLTITAGPPSLTVTGVSPSRGGIAGGTSVTVSGTNFASGATVTFGGTAATGVVFNNSTSLTAVTPAHVVGAVDVTVTNPSTQAATLQNGYTYTGLLSHYSFDVAGTPGKDVVSSYDATNVVSVTQTSGKVGNGGSFAAGYMDLPTPTAFNLRSSDFTLEAFVNSSSTTNANWFTKAAAGPVHQYGLGTAGSTKAIFSFDGGTGGSVTSTSNVFNGAWHHVAGIKRGSTIEIWVDGKLEASGPVSGTSDSGAFAIGRNGACCESFTGMIDEAKIYNYALTSSEVIADALATDLTIVKSAPPSATVGQGLGYSIAVTNNGPIAATNVVVTDTLPAGTSFVSATSSQGSCSGSSTVTCSLGTIANGGNATVSITATATTNGTITNTATVSANEPDPTPSDDSSSATTLVSALTCAAPTISAGGPTSFCTGGNVVLTANATNPSSYQWFLNNVAINGATASSFTASAGGSYTVRVVYPNTCNATSAATTVTANASPSAVISAPSTACPNANVSASVPSSAGATYAWTATNAVISNGQGSDVVNFTPNGNGNVALTVNITDANGCSATGNATVNVGNFTPTITPSGPTSFCTGGSVTLTAQSGASYLWSNGAQTQSIVVTGSGTFSVTVASGAGCSGTSSPVTVNVTPPPAAAINASGPTTFCAPGSVTLTASPAGGSYLWSNGSTTQSITVFGSGTFNVNVTVNGCSATSANMSVTVNPAPIVGITGPSTFCAGTPITLDAGPGFASYLWSNGATTQTITDTPAATTTYSVTVTNASNCSSTTSKTVTMAGSPTPAIAAPPAVCANSSGNSASVSPVASATYAWTIANGSITAGQGTTAITFSAGPSGNVTLGITITGTSCGGNSSAAVPIQQALTPAIAGPTSTCPNVNFVLDAGAGFATYSWSNGATTRTITVSQTAATTYSVTVTTSAGCSGTASHTVTMATSGTVAISAPASVTAGSSGHTASVPAGPAGTTYAWSITNGSITAGQGTPSITFTGGPSGTLNLGVSVNNGGCISTGSANVALTALADLAISIAAPSSVNSGAPLSYVLNVSNLGPTTAQNVVVTNNLPAGVAFGNASGTGWTCAAQGNLIGCTAQSVPVGNATPITINAAAPAAGGTITDTATVSANTADPKSSNNSVSVTTTVNVPTPQCANTPPSLNAPANGATSVANPVTFSWSAVQNAIAYDLFVNGSVAASTTSTSVTLGMPAGPISWYVVARFSNCQPVFSETRTFTVAAAANCTHGAPQLIGATPNANGVTFQWTAVPEAINYRVWVAIDGGAAQDIGTTGGALSLTASIVGTNVSWFVEALFNGCPSTTSESASFTIPRTDPCASHGSATLVAPTNNSTSNASAITFQWTAAAGATGYRVFAAIDGAPFANLGTTGDTTLGATLTNGAVEWYVQALFDGCPSLDSAHFTFTIPRAQNCPSSGAVPQSPVNVTLDHSPVQFDWSAAPNAIGYELWLSLDHGPASLLGTTTGTTTLVRNVAAGALEWYVVSRFNGCPGVESPHVAFTMTTPPNCPTAASILTVPGDNTAVGGPVDFRWSSVAGTTQYQVFAARNGGAPSLIGTTPDLHLDSRPLQSGAWQWFVVSTFAGGCSSTQSAPGLFTVAPIPPECAPPAIPAVRAGTNASSNVAYTIRWTSVGNAGFYEIQQSLSPDFPAGSTDTDAVYGTEKSYKHVNNTNAAIFFYYRVRAVGSCDATVKSLFSPMIAVAVLPTQNTTGAAPADDPQPVSYTLSIPTQPGQPFSATANESWITVTPASGVTTSDTLVLTVTATTSGLPVGTSTAAISVFFGSPSRISANGTSTSTTVNVNLVQPVAPGSKNTPPPDALIIPAIAHAGGINSNFQSDVRITNTAPQVQKYQLTFTPDGDSAKSTTVSIDPGKTLALDDILATWFGNGTSAIGTLEIRTVAATSTASSPSSTTPSVTTFASSRTYNVTANGTFGQYIPAIPFAQFIDKSGLISLQQIASSDAFRTNLGLLEGSGNPATVLVSVFGNNGAKLTEFTQTLAGGQHLQMNGILSAKGLTNLTDGRIEVKLTSAGGKVTAYASVLDNATNDPLLVTPVSISTTGAPKYVLPGIADLNNGNANWRSDVRIYNPSSSAVNATATFYPLGGGDPVSKSISIGPNEVKQLDGALQTLFGLTNTGGALHITTANNAPLVATARTYNQTSNGTYGQFIPAVTPNDAVGKGGRALQILQVEESDRFRSNVGVTEVTGKSAKVEISAIPPDSKFAVTGTFDFGPNEYRQYSSLLKSLGLDTAYNTRVTVRVIDGDGKVSAYASVVDQKTQDPNYVNAQ